MDILELRALQRTEKGKGPAGRLRAQGRVPAVFYGEKRDPVPVSVDGRELHSVMRAEGGVTAIVKLMIDGDKGQTAMIKDVQRDPLRDRLLHVDFLKIAMDEKITTNVSLAVVGDALGVREGGVLQEVRREVEVETLPTDLPEHIEVDVTELAVGESLRVADLVAPPGVTILTNPEEMILSVIPPTKLEEVAPPVEEVEEGEVEVVGEEAPAGEGQGPAEETTGE